MARYIEFNQEKITRLKREAQQFQDDIVCAVGTDFMQKIAEAENRMIFDILNGLENEPTADVAPKSEVVRLTIDMNAARLGMIAEHERLKMARADVAREIFDEIERILSLNYCCCLPQGATEHYEYYEGNIAKDIAELKKKYTGEKEDE